VAPRHAFSNGCAGRVRPTTGSARPCLLPGDIAGTLTTMAFSNEMFHLGLPILEKIARPIIVYASLVLLLRVFGKRELAQLNPFDLVVLLSLSNTVQNAIIGNDNSVTGGLLGALSLLVTNYFVVRFLFRHRRIDQILEGSPTVLVDKGKVSRKGLAKELLTEAELAMVCRRQGFAHVNEVESCILEPGGAFSLQGKTPSADEKFRKDVLNRLDEICRRLDESHGATVRS
jgi:uncharacterized membrane protein YcaP (DUF421 family)